MKVLFIAADKGGHFTPFIEEQMQALVDNTPLQAEDIICFPVRGKGILGYMKELPRLRETIRTERPDVVHAHYGLCGLLANLQRSVPVVTTYHGSDINDKRVRLFSEMAMVLSEQNIFVSRATMCKTVVRPSHARLVPCGVDFTAEQQYSQTDARKEMNIQQDQMMVLFAGAFSNAVKDPALAKESVAYFNQEYAGDAPAMLKELKGYTRKEVNLLLCAADCLLLTSHAEGSPQIIKEALACGCPIVSVDAGDVRERIADMPDCYVCRSREPKEIARLLTEIQQLSHEQGTQKRKQRQATMRQYLVDNLLTNAQVARVLYQIYERVLNG